MTEKTTTITVRKSIREELEKLKIHERQPVDEVIEELLNKKRGR